MNGVNFRYGMYMNESCFSLSLVYALGEVRGLQPHVRTRNHFEVSVYNLLLILKFSVKRKRRRSDPVL